jgi:hypothetical protein
MALFFLLGFVFFISPIFGAILSFIALFFYHTKKVKVLISFFYLSLFLGLLNSLKVPENDLVNYIRLIVDYQDADFNSYVFSFGKEPLFMAFNYIVRGFIFGSVALYLIIFTVICYMFIFYSIWRVHMKIKLHVSTFALSIAVAFLFPNLFLLSAHLLRQFLAASIVLFFAVEHIFYQKKAIVSFVSSFLIHTTSLLFGFLFLPFFNKKQKNVRIFLLAGSMGGGIGFLYSFADVLYQIFVNVPVLSYLLYRLQGKEDAWETDSLGLLNFALQLFIVFVFYIMSTDFRLKKWELPIQNIYILSLFLLVFVAINFNNTEIALRFSFYMYFLFPLAVYFLPFLLSKAVSESIQKMLFLIITLLFLIWFLLKINFGMWTYNNLESLVFII